VRVPRADILKKEDFFGGAGDEVPSYTNKDGNTLTKFHPIGLMGAEAAVVPFY
jgi:hypothetical protein